jgi:hypothetical protein
MLALELVLAHFFESILLGILGGKKNVSVGAFSEFTLDNKILPRDIGLMAMLLHEYNNM